MATHKKDLRRSGLREHDAPVVIVVDDPTLPIIKTVFVNGREMFMPTDGSVKVELNADKLTEVTLTVIPSSVEVITEQEMEQRLQ